MDFSPETNNESDFLDHSDYVTPKHDQNDYVSPKLSSGLVKTRSKVIKKN